MNRRLTPLAVVIALASVASANWVHHNAPKGYQDVQRAQVGQEVRVSPTQSLKVIGVQASSVVAAAHGNGLVTSPGVFVGVDVQLTTTGRREVGSSKCTLRTSGSNYPASFYSSDGFPPPGFSSPRLMVFEVPADQLDHPHLQRAPYQMLAWYSITQDIDLGMDGDQLRSLADRTPQGIVRRGSDPVEVVHR